MFSILVISILTVFSLFILYQYIRVRRILNDINKPLRKGYYKDSLRVIYKIPGVEDVPFYPTVYIIETDRYTSGESKIKIDYIDVCISETDVFRERVKKYIQNKFESVVKTSNINWLESELSIKEMRREKLAKLKKSLKFK